MSTFKARQKALRSSTQKFLATSALTAAGLVSMGITANAQNVAPDALPQGAEVTRGSATYDYSQPNTLTIEQHAALTSAEYKGGFNIGQNAAVLMLQDSGDIFVHIDKSDNTSFIEGLFSGSGSNFVLNKNGVIVTGTARIDMNSFVASTAESLDLDRLDAEGKAVFTDFGEGAIIIEEGATVTVAEAGLAAFVSPFVSNAGVINARMGTVAIGAAETVTLDLYGDGLVELAVEGELGDALIENTGTISAEGGKVQISARAAKDAVDNIINVDGVVTASSASVQGGKIVLSGGNKGTVAVKGTVDASGEGAGDIDVTGENITIADTAELKADGGENGDGGNIKIIASDKAIFRGSASARGGAVSGKGGFVETSGHGYISVGGGTVDTRAADGTAGLWLIDPADITIVDGTTGGDFIPAGVASSTIGWGDITAALLGNNVLISTANGVGGNGDITFAQAAGASISSGLDRTLEFAADRDIVVNEFLSLLNFDVILGAGRDVVFNDQFGLNNADLTVNAGDDIFVNSGATVGATASAGNVTLSSMNNDGGLSAIEIDGSVVTQGGKITLNADDYFVEVNATGAVTTNGGDLEVNSNHGFDIDNGGNVDLVDGDAHINTPRVQLGDDIVTTGTITGTATSVAVENDDAQIGDGVGVAAAGATVTVGDGTFVENVMINKALTLLSENGRDFTTIEGVSGVGALGTVQFKSGTSGVQLGDTDQGFTIVGIDNGAPGIENAAVYLQGAQSDHVIKGNDIVANGDSGLTSEYSAVVTNILIDNNIFSGQTFVGPTPADYGFSNQFTTPNVPRQLVVMGGGVGGSNTSNITFSNNTITGIAGALDNGAGLPQGNTLVTIDADTSEITGNTFMGTTARFGASLRARGDGTLISGNTFYASGLTDTNSHITVTNNVYTGIAGQDDVIDIWDANTFVGRATVSSDDVSPVYDGIGLTIQGAVDASNAGATIFVNDATYAENVNIAKNGLTLKGAKAGTVGQQRDGSDESVVEGYFRTEANVDGLVIDGFTFSNQGEVVPGYGDRTSIALNNNVQNVDIINNRFLGNDEAGSFGVTTSIAGVENILIRGNLFTELNGGIYVNPNAVDVDIRSNRFFDNNFGAIAEGDAKVRGNAFINNAVTGLEIFGEVSMFNNNAFRGNGQHIAYRNGAGADLLVDESTGNRFFSDGAFKYTDDMTEAELFALEDLVTHKMDDAGNGLVVFRDGELFVTQGTGGIQHAINIADAGDTVNVDGTTYTEDLVIDKALKLTGHGTTLQSAGADNLITVTAANVNIDPFTFDGMGVALYGIHAVGANGLIVDGNSFTGFVEAAIELASSKNVKVFGNDITGGKKGIHGDDVENIQVFENEVIDTTVAGIHIENSDGTGYDGGGKDVDLWKNTVAAASGIGILIQNSAFATVGPHPTNPFASGFSGGNVVSGGSAGIVVEGSDNAYVAYNTVDSVSGNGITVDGGTGVSVLTNKVGTSAVTDNIGGEGVLVDGSTGALVQGNEITETGSNGIKLTEADDSFVQGNDVSNTGHNGIVALDSNNVTINMTNVVSNTHAAGVSLNRTTNSLVDGNDISNTGGSGVWINEADGSTVSGNIIDGTWKRAGAGTGSGVHVVSTDDATVSGNTIDNTNRGGNGVYAEGSDNLKVNGNFIGTVGGNISGNGVAIDGAKTAEVNGNEIKNVAKNGIKFIKGIKDGAVEVINNDITAALTGILFGSSSPSVENSTVYVVTNTVTASDDAVRFDDAIDNSTVEFNGNTLTAGSEGIDVLGAVTDSRVTLGGNVADPGYSFAFQTINADDNGVVFRGDVTGSQIYMPRQQITALDGEAVLFKGVVDNSRVSIGQGEGDFGGVWLSNINGFFTGSETGILFEENVQNSSVIEIVNTTVTGQGGEGVHFEGDVDGSSVLIAGSTVSGQDGDAIQFEGEVTNSSTVRIGEGTAAPLPLYTAAFGPFPLSYGGNTITGSENGIVFNGVNGGSTVDIDDNIKIEGQSNDGIVFNGASPSISGGAVVNIKDNTEILADNDGIKVEDDISGSGTQLNIRDNKIVAGEDGIDIDNVRNNAIVKIGGSSYSRDGNWIIAGDDGIEFDAGIDSTVLIQKNRIDAGDDGIDIADDDRRHTTSIDSGAVVSILENRIGSEGSDTIGDDGIVIDENITGGATLTISGNSIGRSGAKVGDDGIDLDNISGGATVNIVNNPNNYASDNGINISGSINGATLNITGNNHGIHADDHGIYVGGAIYGGSTVNIHDNIISANEDDGRTGDGIHFAGNIYTANINIGDGSGSSLYSNPSNFIRGKDGIHFAGSLNSGTKVKIDGNRIGYGERSYGRYPIFSDAVSDDGIQFAQDVQGNANVKITDNYIKSDDDGVSFLDDIQDDARVLIGGRRDGNTIDADDEGIQFGDEIKGHSLLEISYNDIDADDNGIQFDGETSNHIHSGHGEEILIKHNSIEGGEHGILFNGKASNWRHDIVIRDNSLIKGGDENGITHVGNIDDAELWILNNDKIDGDEDGIHIEGYFYNGAKIVIEGNGWDGGVRGRDDDGIHVKDTGYDFGSDVLIKKNHVHYTGDDGIFVRNVKGVKIIENDIHDTGLESRDGDGIFVVDSDYALIKKNEITGAGRDGINLYSSYRADILFNDIYAEGGNRFLGRGQQGAGRDGIHVEYSDKVDVIGNDITSDLGYGRYAVDQLGAGRHGIYVAHSDGADVKFNDVLGDARTFFGFPIASVDSVGENGIYVYKSHFADVKFNDVERTGENGIKLRKSAFGDIGFNKVDRAGDDGIDVEYGFFVDIFGNKVSKSREDGIDVEDSFGADIKFNKVTESRRDGIEVDDSKYADIKYNLVVGAGDDGIDVDDSKFADIEYNLISFTKDDGIRVDDSFGANIMRNLVAFAGDDGIDVSDSSYVDVNGNFIRFVKRNGIEVSGGKQADIIGNNIRFVGRDGINVRNVYSMYNRGFDVVINENTVRDAGDDGIEVKYSGDTQIDFNTVTDVEDDGIRVYNPRGSFIMSYPDMYDDGPSMNIMRVSAYPYYEFVPANVEITNNTVTNAGTDGIEVTAYDVQLLADTNTVLNSGENGILLNALGGYGRYEDRVDDLQTVSLVSTTPYPSMRKGNGPQGPGVFNSVLINNGVENSGTNGIHAKGYGHGDVVLEGNTLVDNPVGARFESGAIDLTNLENPNTIIVNPDYELPEGYEFVTGLQFELAGTSETVASANSLTIVDETLGATAFTGFINRPVEEAFYVRFEDGAILDEFGNVIVINGEQVNFDGFIPANNQDAFGNIPAVALSAIEDRLFDADDPLLDGRGQIFIGTPATAGLDNVQDFFQQFSQFAPGFGGFNLTLLGLPPTSPPVGGFNNIQTFAGPGALNDINPAAGGESPEGLNDLEPAAGNESACWSDVINASATGGVNFNFSGDPTDNLNAAASCDS